MCVPVMWDMRIEGDGAVCVKVEGHERERDEQGKFILLHCTTYREKQMKTKKKDKE